MGRKISKEKEVKITEQVIATGFYIGYLPVAPATFSCILSTLLWFFLIPLKPVYIFVTLSLLIVGTLLSHKLVRVWGKDPRQIVIDEYASLLIPLYFTPKRIVPFMMTFLLFRIFDIVKPPPLRRLEKLPGGWGVMLDDIGAALYTTVIMIVIQIFITL